VFQLIDRFPTVSMPLLLCVHMNIVFLLLYLHFAIGLLEKSDLDVVASELDAVSSKWYNLGQQLLSPYHHDHLDSIHILYPRSPMHMYMRETISKRMEHYACLTWSDIVEGLRSSGDSQLADHLETKYCSSKLITVLHSHEMEYKKRLLLK